MKDKITLLHMPCSGPSGWGVFYGCDCPDPHGFAKYTYRPYEDLSGVSSDRVFLILLEVKRKLEENKILPSPDNESKIFPTENEIRRWRTLRQNVLSRIDSIIP